jgi:hypothetical protein
VLNGPAVPNRPAALNRPAVLIGVCTLLLELPPELLLELLLEVCTLLIGVCRFLITR